jgi:hypothetical protein
MIEDEVARLGGKDLLGKNHEPFISWPGRASGIAECRLKKRIISPVPL